MYEINSSDRCLCQYGWRSSWRFGFAENIPCDLAKVKISENDDGTYTAKIPVTEPEFDCNSIYGLM